MTAKAQPTFSFILPAFNVAPWIAESLDSLLRQTVGDWECICADDGSTDGTADLLDAYARKDARFRVVHLSHVGVAGARNAALELTRGRWIGFLDGDDVLAPNLLEECRQAIQAAPDAEMVAFDVSIFAGPSPNFVQPSPIPPPCRRDISQRLGLASLGFYFYGRLYTRDLLRTVRFRDFAPSEDYVFLTEATCQATSQTVIPASFYGYRTRPGSQVNSKVTPVRIVHLLEAVHAICDLLIASKRTVEPPLARSLANDAAERFAREYARLDKADRPQALDALRRHYPFFAQVSFFSLFQKLRFRILALCPCRPLFGLLCGLPETLKLHGLHRRAPAE